MKTILIFGATSAIAEHCARLWIKQNVRLLLVGRDAARLAALAQDLAIRGGPQAQVSIRAMDALDYNGYGELVAWAISQSDATVLDGVLIAHGILPDQKQCEFDLSLAHRSIETNGVSPVLLAEAFSAYFAKQGHGFIGVVGSVAGDRGRQSNYVYGAAKGLVEHYLQGLRNRLHASNVDVILIKPGPTDTPMTIEFKAKGTRLADPADVADAIVKGIERRAMVIYAPGIWRWIMLIIRHIPERIFVKLKL